MKKEIQKQTFIFFRLPVPPYISFTSIDEFYNGNGNFSRIMTVTSSRHDWGQRRREEDRNCVEWRQAAPITGLDVAPTCRYLYFIDMSTLHTVPKISSQIETKLEELSDRQPVLTIQLKSQTILVLALVLSQRFVSW